MGERGAQAAAQAQEAGVAMKRETRACHACLPPSLVLHPLSAGLGAPACGTSHAGFETIPENIKKVVQHLYQCSSHLQVYENTFLGKSSNHIQVKADFQMTQNHVIEKNLNRKPKLSTYTRSSKINIRRTVVRVRP